MSKIDINIDGLKKNADTIAAKKQELQTLNKNLENLIKEINDKWKGDASVSYTNMLNKYLAQAKKMESVLNEFHSYATNVSNTFENLDQNAAGRINR
jgi:WXG100 family type VII secretion target